MTLVLPFLFVFLSAVFRVCVGCWGGKRNKIAPHILQLHLQKIATVSLCFFFFFLEKVFKIVQLQTPVIRGHVRLYLARKPLSKIQHTSSL